MSSNWEEGRCGDNAPEDAAHFPSRREFLQQLAAGVLLGSAAAWAPQTLWAAPAVKKANKSAGKKVKTVTVPRVDEYWDRPRAGYNQRRQALLEYCAAGSSVDPRQSYYSQIARLELGKPIDEAPFRVGIDYIYSNKDCNDFTVSGLLRILYRYRAGGKLPAPLLESIDTCLLKFKYWWDEPGTDDRCYHTENHQIVYHSDQLLAGQLFPDRVFPTSGRTGRQHVAIALPMIRRWMDWRIRFGFSEWLSNCYFNHDLMALTNLRDFAEQPDIRARAEMLIDLMLFEIALHSHRGVFGSTHGRTYARMIKGGRGEHTTTLTKLLFGMGLFFEPDNMGALALATSSYRCPAVIEAVAADLDRTILCRERHSLNVEDAPRYGLSYDKEEDVVLYWSVQEYNNPLVIDASEKISKASHVRNFEKYEDWRKLYQKQIADHGRIVDPWLTPQALGEVHILTQRAPAYMLSCAQDYRPGRGGYQQHIWQATLGLDAVVFTNHPGSADEGARPDFWAGNNILPRAAQHGNVVVCIHHIPASDPLPFSHAYFPRAAFDEVIQRDHWIFARKGNGYLALYSQHPTRWLADAQKALTELRADAADNIWICEMSSNEHNRDFAEFVMAVSGAPAQCDGLRVQYKSPLIGELSFGWEGPLKIAGAETALHDYPRFDNPYCQSSFLAPRAEIRHGKNRLTLDFKSNQREVV